MLVQRIKKALKRLYSVFCMFLFDPITVIVKLWAFPVFVSNLFQYSRLNHDKSFRIRIQDIHYTTYGRYSKAGSIPAHYFYQDLWAAKKIHDSGINEHVDVGSRIDGFVAHILPFCRVTYVDIRSLGQIIEGLNFLQGSILAMPFPSNSVQSLSCLHVIEHIGLGRYGGDVTPDGYLNAAAELTRVLMPNGVLLLGVPVGRQRVCFDAHRVFAPKTILDAFGSLEVEEFSLIDDRGDRILRNVSIERGAQCNYGCGLFVFRKSK